MPIVKALDPLQQRLTQYAFALDYQELPREVLHAAKVRIIDTLGALICGFFAEPCRIAREVALQIPGNGATVIGTGCKTTPDMAAFANASTARYVEFTDTYHWPGSYHGHPSDVIMPVLAAAEHARVSGRDFILGVVLAYEVFLRFNDVFPNRDFDNTNFACIGTAVAAGKLLGLSSEQLAHCIAMAVVPNNTLSQVRLGRLSMFKAVAAGQAGRAGLFAALLARAGMEGPHLPFAGKAGWCDHIARGALPLSELGGSGMPFKIVHTILKSRPCPGVSIAMVLAAEKIAPLSDIERVRKITVEVYEKAKYYAGTDEHLWSPESRESADHSGPYLVAATLMDGTLTPRSYNDAHLHNPELRALMQKIEIVTNDEFTRAYEATPQQHRTRITVTMDDGRQLAGEGGGGQEDPSMPLNDEQVEKKFVELTGDTLGAKRIQLILDRLWNLEDLQDIADIPASFALI